MISLVLYTVGSKLLDHTEKSQLLCRDNLDVFFFFESTEAMLRDIIIRFYTNLTEIYKDVFLLLNKVVVFSP